MIGIKEMLIKDEIEDVLKIKTVINHIITKEIPIFKERAKQIPK